MIRVMVLTAAGLLAATAAAGAQQTPCVPCAIGHVQSQLQVQQNQILIREALQNSLNAQLQGQSSSLQTQALLRSLQLRGAMNASSADLQQVLLQQQIQLLQIEQQAIQSQRTPNPPRKGPKPKKAPAATP